MFNFNIDGSAVAQGDLTVLGDATLNSNLTVNGSITNTEFQTAVAQAAAAQPGFVTMPPLSMALDVPSGEFRLGIDLPPSAFQLPHNHDTWVKLGTLSGLSEGRVAVFDLAITAGYNSLDSQARAVRLQFVTANSGSSQTADDGLPFFGYCLGHGDFPEIRVKQIAQNATYEFYYLSPPFPGVGVLEVRANDTWTHEATAVSEPTGTWINPTITHSISSTQATFNTPVVCQFDLQCGDLTANAIYGGAVTQINSAIAAAAPLWDAGELTNQNTGTNNQNFITSQQRYMTTHPVTFATAFTQPPIVIPNMRGNATGHATIDRIWVEGGVTTTGCNIVVADRSGSGGVHLTWYAIQQP